MGKTVGAILLIAAVVAINFIPGVGQAVTAGLVSAGLTAGTAAAVTATLTAVVTAAALGAASQLLTSAPKLNAPETARTALKTSTPPRVSAYGRGRLWGAYVLFANTDYSLNSDTYAPYAIDVFAIHEGPIDAIELRYLGDDAVTLTAFGGVNFLPNNQYGGIGTDYLVKWYETLGATPGTANFADIIAKLPGKWTVDHRGDGVVCLGIVWRPVSGDEFSERFPQGAAPASIVARWQKVFDPRDGTQAVNNPASWKWSENAVLHLLHYRLVREKARTAPGAVLPSGAALTDAWNLFFQPTVNQWKAAATVCDENIPLKAGGTEKRYRSCFAHQHTDPHKDVMDALTACFDGWTSPRADGALVVYAGKYYAPTVDIGPDEIVSYSWQYGVVDEEAVNEFKITYVSSQHDYQPVDAEPWQDTDDMAERGAIRTQGIDYQVPSHGQARRLTKRLMARVMAANRGLITTNVAGRIVRGQRYINLKIEEAGAIFFDGVAEITGLTRNMATGGVTFSWVEANANIDAWNAVTEEGEPAPVGNRIVLVQPPAPVVQSAVLIYDSPAAGTTGARVMISLNGPSGTDLTWFARWRVVGDPIWNEQRYSDVDSSAGVDLITGFVPTGENIEVEVAYTTGTGALSPWSSPPTVVGTDTETVAPPAAAAPTLLQWAASLDMKVAAIPRASSYRWRFYTSNNITLLGEIITAGPNVSLINTQAATWGIKRAYKVRVAGINSAGIGGEGVSVVLNKAAPAAVTGFSVANDAYTAAAVFTPSSNPAVAGYLFAFSRTSGFDPLTAGFTKTGNTSPIYYYGLSADTYFGKVAAYDLWSSNPSLLNFTAQDTFDITTGGGGQSGGAPGGGGGGGTGGGGGGWWNPEQPDIP